MADEVIRWAFASMLTCGAVAMAALTFRFVVETLRKRRIKLTQGRRHDEC